MTQPTATVPRLRGRRRRIVAVLSVALVAGLLAIGAIPHSDSANALPPLPPPIPPTTIFNPPTTLGTAPPPPDYLVNVLLLNQDTKPGTAPLGAVAADRYWLQQPIITNGATTAVAASGPIGTIYDPIPAGTSSLISGNHFAFPADAMPSGALMTLRVREAGVPGSLCRTRPVSPLPPTGQYLHLLVAPPVATNAAALNAMVAGFTGVVPNTPAGISVNIVSASLTPQANGLQLRLLGGLFVNSTWAFVFEYKVTLTLVPLNGTDTNQLLTVQAPAAGALNLAWYGTPPAGGDAIKAFITGGMEPQLRAQVLTQARPLVNDAVRLNHDVVWWTEQGFTMSVRKVAYSTSALTVYGALCRLG